MPGSLQHKWVRQIEWSKDWISPKTGFNEYWERVVNEDPTLQRVALCIDLIFGGNTRLRISNKAVTLRNERTGMDHGFKPYLMETPTINHNYTLGTGSASARSFAMTVGQLELDCFDLIRSGLPLAGWGEVFLAIDGMAYEDRFIIMRGDMTGGVAFGDKDEIVEFELVDPIETDDISITPFICYGTTGEDESDLGEAVEGNFPNLGDSAEGKRFPLLINQYAHFECIPLNTGAVTFPTGNLKLMVAMNSPEGELTVNELHRNGVPVSMYSVATSRDRHYKAEYTEITYAGTSVEESDSFHCKAVEAKQRGIIEVIQYLVEYWSLLGPRGVNNELFSYARAKMPGMNPACLINGSGGSDGTEALSYIESTLCESYPMISMTYFGGGYGPVVTDRRSDLVRAKFVVGQGPIMGRVSAYQETSKADVFNRFVVRYGYDPMKDTYSGTVVRDSHTSDICRISEEICGLRDAGSIDSIILPNHDQAVFVADWLVAHKALPSYYVEYECLSSVALYCRIGDNLDIQDPRISETDFFRATIESINLEGGRVVMGVRLWILYPQLGGGARSGSVSWTSTAAQRFYGSVSRVK